MLYLVLDLRSRLGMPDVVLVLADHCVTITECFLATRRLKTFLGSLKANTDIKSCLACTIMSKNTKVKGVTGMMQHLKSKCGEQGQTRWELASALLVYL